MEINTTTRKCDQCKKIVSSYNEDTNGNMENAKVKGHIVIPDFYIEDKDDSYSFDSDLHFCSTLCLSGYILEIAKEQEMAIV